MAQEYLPISFRQGSQDHKIFDMVINQGIDSHLEGFTKSKFSEHDGRIFCDFHHTEEKILVRRLEEIFENSEDADISEAAYTWAEDIKSDWDD
jgi:hypothetical protein